MTKFREALGKLDPEAFITPPMEADPNQTPLEFEPPPTTVKSSILGVFVPSGLAAKPGEAVDATTPVKVAPKVAPKQTRNALQALKDARGQKKPGDATGTNL